MCEAQRPGTFFVRHKALNSPASGFEFPMPSKNARHNEWVVLRCFGYGFDTTSIMTVWFCFRYSSHYVGLDSNESGIFPSMHLLNGDTRCPSWRSTLH